MSVAPIAKLCWLALAAIGVGAALLGIEDPVLARGAALAWLCLVLWLSELIPLYATTMILMAGAALLLAPLRPGDFALHHILAWSAQPVMALFFGGFALSVAGAKYGLDSHVASWMLRLARGSRAALLATVMLGTALLSMWMCNIAAAAMMIATLHPILDQARQEARFRQALLVGIAFAANLGGMGTPIGTGPNLIAIGAAARFYEISFLHWVLFATPLVLLMLALAYALLAALHGVRGRVAIQAIPVRSLARRGWIVVAIFACAIGLWLTEPLHSIPAPVTALIVSAVLFAGRLLDASDIGRIEWDTLMLIAGGLTLGELFSRTGLADVLATAVQWSALPRVMMTFGFVFACALLAAVASNTAAAAMLIQIGLSIVPEAHFAVLVALGASMGMPFVISTPPNALAYGQGGLQPAHLAIPGTILMLVGCALLAITGPTVLRWMGVP
ncbi:MAG: DASS family sodium-coupled anion symporter [Phycisphaerae bacterium]|nr:DASS family sodium-coupled anion symporter [Phycisphaerae bacterium]MDW8262751.1 DASS family sodium-coupled anion symporter [Phycisphaerales bacterium]